MLYATTRSDHDTFTPERALKERRAPDGGFYVPMQIPAFTSEELEAVLDQSVSGVLASVMNEFFSCKLTGPDVEFCLDKRILNLRSFSHRIAVAEYWRNSEGSFNRIPRVLAGQIAVDKRWTPVGEWVQVAARIAMLFCDYSLMCKQGLLEPGGKLDVAVLAGDFSEPMAAWYARQMGLPIGNIVICCNENGAVWDLLKRGEIKADQSVRKTSTPRCDIAHPEGVEQLIRATLGVREVQRYLETKNRGEAYQLNKEQHRRLGEGMQVCVVSDRRLSRVIANTYTTHGYVMCPYGALVYSGLMDYRAATGKNGPALIVCENSPLQCQEAIAKAMGISASEVRQRIETM